MAEFRVFRFDPDRNVDPHFDKFNVPVTKMMSIMDGLEYIFDTLDPTVAFPRESGFGRGGGDVLHVNGAPRSASTTSIAELQAFTIEVRPLPHFEVIRDLIVDLTPLYEKWAGTFPFIQNDEDPGDTERLQSPGERSKLDPWIDCNLCGACESTCPPVATSDRFLGPSTLTSVFRFIEDSRDRRGDERLDTVDGDHGVFRCHSVAACQETCTMGLAPNKAIGTLRNRLLWKRLSGR